MTTIYHSDSFKSGTSVSDLGLGRWTITNTNGKATLQSAKGRFGGQSLQYSGFGNDSSGAQLVKAGLGNIATVCLHMPIRNDASTISGGALASFYDGSTQQVSLCLNPSGQIVVTRGGYNGTILATSSFALTASVYYVLEFKVTFHGSAGVIEVHCWGPGAPSSAVIISSTGSLNTAPSGNAYFNKFALGPDGLGQGGGGPQYIVQFEHVVLIDTFQGDKRFFTDLPNGTSSTQWTPNASTNLSRINEAQEDGDTTYNSSSTPGQIDLFTFAASIAGLQNIVAVIISIWYRKDDAGARQVSNWISSSGVTAAGTTVNPSTTYAEQLDQFYVDPNTSAAWLKTGVDAMAAGYREVA